MYTKTEKSKNFFLLLFFTELWERFSYYGMRALLVLYLTSTLGFADKSAYAIYALYAALCYTGPVIGGIIADKLLGFRNIVKIGAILITLGHTGMVFISKDQLWILYFSLALVAVGSGFFKGNLMNLLGLCYDDGDPKRDKAFSLFYVSVNLGSFIASIACGFAAKQYGWHYGFALAGVGMFIGLITFLKFEHMLGDVGKMNIIQQKINKTYKTGFMVLLFAITLSALCALMLSYSEISAKIVAAIGVTIYLYLGKMLVNMTQEERKNIILLTIMTIFLMLFFSIEMQLGSLFNLFTARNVDTNLFGYAIPAASLQSLNPMSIMLLGPILAPLFVRFGIGFSIMRIGVGIFSIVLSLLILYIGCKFADNNKVSISYLIVSMVIMGAGELFIAPLIQDLYTRLSPLRIRGFMMGLLMLSLSFSNLAGNIIAMFVSIETGESASINLAESLVIYQNGFGQFTLCGVGVLIIYAILYPMLNKQYLSNFAQDQNQAKVADQNQELEDEFIKLGLNT